MRRLSMGLLTFALALVPLSTSWAQTSFTAGPKLTLAEQIGLVLFIMLLVFVVIANHLVFDRTASKRRAEAKKGGAEENARARGRP